MFDFQGVELGLGQIFARIQTLEALGHQQFQLQRVSASLLPTHRRQLAARLFSRLGALVLEFLQRLLRLFAHEVIAHKLENDLGGLPIRALKLHESPFEGI